MSAGFADYDKRMNRLTEKTEARLGAADKAIREVEANTLWKIRDTERLLTARPTLQYVQSAIADEAREALVAARVYTDEQFAKVKQGGGGGGGADGDMVQAFDEFRAETE